MRFIRRYSSASTRRRNRRLGLSSVPGLNNVIGKQTKLFAKKATARTRASFVTTFCVSLLRNAPPNCENGKRRRSRIYWGIRDHLFFYSYRCCFTPHTRRKATPQSFLDCTDKLWWLLLHNNQSGRRSPSSRRRRDPASRSLCKRSERRSYLPFLRKLLGETHLRPAAFPLFQT